MPLTFLGLRVSSDLGIRGYPAVLLATALVFLCLGFFEVVRRARATSFLFGIKAQKV
jgi:hypothetical protein